MTKLFIESSYFVRKLLRRKLYRSDKAVFVQSIGVDDDNRVASIIQANVAGDSPEPFWLLIPINPLVAAEITHVTIHYGEDSYEVVSDFVKSSQEVFKRKDDINPNPKV